MLPIESESNCENEEVTTENENEKETVLNDNTLLDDDRSDISNDSITNEILRSILNSEKTKTY